MMHMISCGEISCIRARRYRLDAGLRPLALDREEAFVANVAAE
jgi:hypothetical protein